MISIMFGAALAAAAQPDPNAEAAFYAYQACLFGYADRASAAHMSQDDFEGGLADQCRAQEQAVRNLGRADSRSDREADQQLIDRARGDARHRFENPSDESGGSGPDQ